ncbi:MAG: ribosomal protein S15 [Candidatus Parvarchaeum acidiphilum ARMAN-4]|jgi:small subunit ribosomal protein S15|uniref:30S ribosomal protein S15 n=1 Tax=Candidatus Parvarchaeum acidiphilum ARMAN-4 TaxID=662760 RepID=D2EG79_PARA4|nr:MAG: ribosomal protein S15 [Candidatus Parvarchaeum acidiphilum ARMAN-4]
MKVINVKNRFVPHWLNYKQEEVEQLILNKSQKGLTKSEIGTVLRDQYGIPSVKDLTKKSVSSILKSRGMTEPLPEDLIALYKKAVKLHMHVDKQKKDKHSIRSLVVLENRIKKLIKYYKQNKILPKDYTYSLESARLVVKI